MGTAGVRGRSLPAVVVCERLQVGLRSATPVNMAIGSVALALSAQRPLPLQLPAQRPLQLPLK